MEYIYAIIGTVLFALFDWLGFAKLYIKPGENALVYDGVKFVKPKNVRLIAYRIIQNMFMASLLANLYYISGGLWLCPALFLLLWWFGVCDFLFYVFNRQVKAMLEWEDMPWLWWTPGGIVCKIFRRKITPLVFLFYTGIGIALFI